MTTHALKYLEIYIEVLILVFDTQDVWSSNPQSPVKPGTSWHPKYILKWICEHMVFNQLWSINYEKQ